MKKGFTLIEMLIYIAISSIVVTAFSSLSFAVINEQSESDLNNEVEINGLYEARIIENEISAGKSVVFPALQDGMILENTTSSQSNGIYNIGFTINKHDFPLSLPTKK